MIELAACMSQAADLVDRALVDHHKQVALISDRIAGEMGVPQSARDNVVMAALVHDIGALTFRERLAATDFDYQDNFTHTEPGYLLLRQYPPFAEVARIVRVHHIEWRNGAGASLLGEPVPPESHMIHVADRVAVLIDPSRPVLDQKEEIVARIVEGSGSRFHPDVVEALVRLARDEVLWLDIVNMPSGAQMLDGLHTTRIHHDWQDLKAFAPTISRIVDFRSVFTATHSAGVAAAATALAGLLGMDEGQISRVEVAGSLHDVGKLAVPTRILEKAGPLDGHEWSQVKAHTYFTRQVLTAGDALSEIADMASFHHERLDESGYPFHIGAAGLGEGARIMAVADIFTAVTEDRPYREGMSREQVVKVLRDSAAANATDPLIVEALVDGFSGIDDARKLAQSERLEEFITFHRAMGERAALQKPYATS